MENEYNSLFFFSGKGRGSKMAHSISIQKRSSNIYSKVSTFFFPSSSEEHMNWLNPVIVMTVEPWEMHYRWAAKGEKGKKRGGRGRVIILRSLDLVMGRGFLSFFLPGLLRNPVRKAVISRLCRWGNQGSESNFSRACGCALSLELKPGKEGGYIRGQTCFGPPMMLEGALGSWEILARKMEKQKET